MFNPPLSSKSSRIPKFEIPASSNIVTVRVIDTTTRLHMAVGTMFEPTIKGHTKLASPSYSFLIEHEQLESKLLFDLGVQKDWQDQAPVVVDMIKEFEWDIQVDKDVAEILQEGKIPLTKIDAIIWSHSHWDHLGDPSTFPNSTDIIVGPGFSEEYFPGGEPEPESSIKPEYYENRNLREISAAEFNMVICGFPAFDYFGDGSFYLLNSPGHAVGHISALARTTTHPDTFIFMGADIASHAGEFRPSRYVPLPTLVSPNPLNYSLPAPCPGHIFEKIHPQECGNSPFYRIGTWPDGESCADDLPAALESHQKLQVIDAQLTQVFVILAHDETLNDVIEFFPKAANHWKQLGWADKTRWMFLRDFKEAITENYIDGQLIKPNGRE